MAALDFLRTAEVGELVVSHVLEDVRQPEPDFEAMRRTLGEPVPQNERERTD
ncbi:MAG TPA: hypothetical protein VHW71_01810 [Steroidobacteraceae bacterium]|nr:hypothetical protein [Steroidobacteraceae bacterium]